MEIYFSSKKLERLAYDPRRCQKEMGTLRAKKFLTRLQDILDARTLEDLRSAPGNYHELTKNRKGQWGCDLDQPYRLIFEPYEKPIPTDDSGRFIWHKIKIVEIIEIVDYHE